MRKQTSKISQITLLRERRTRHIIQIRHNCLWTLQTTHLSPWNTKKNYSANIPAAQCCTCIWANLCRRVTQPRKSCAQYLKITKCHTWHWHQHFQSVQSTDICRANTNSVQSVTRKTPPTQTMSNNNKTNNVININQKGRITIWQQIVTEHHAKFFHVQWALSDLCQTLTLVNILNSVNAKRSPKRTVCLLVPVILIY